MALEIRTLTLQSGNSIKCTLIRNNNLYEKVMNLYTSGSGESTLLTNKESIQDIISWCLGEDLHSYIINYNVSSDYSFSNNTQTFLSQFRTNNINNPSFPSSGSLTTNGLLNNILPYMAPVGETRTRYGSDSWWAGIHFPYSIYSALSDGGYIEIPLLGDLDLNGYAIYLTIGYNRYSYSKWSLTVTMCDARESWMSVIGKHASDTYKAALLSMYEGYTPDVNDPYTGGGYSGSGGGDPQKQNWAEASDLVVEDLMPDEINYSAQSCGLITIFTPSKSQLQRLSDVIWGQGFFNWVQNMVQNISDFFISLGMVPFSITPGQSVEVTWLNYVVAGATSFTDIYLYKCPNQFMEFNMGSIALDGSDDRVFAMDSALDYSPYSKLGIYLPFIGYQELDIDECRNQTITLKYRIDVLSGTTVALINVGGRTIYQFTGNCLTQLPITSADYQTMVTNAVNLGLSLASAGATGAIASAGDAVSAERISEGSLTAAEQGLQSTQRTAQVASAGGGALSATANAIMGMKPNFKKSGGIGASASLLSVKQPYLFLTTPRQSMPEGYNKVCGFPCNIYGTLGSFSGYTVVEDIRLNGLVATSPEVEEIYQLLKTGVII